MDHFWSPEDYFCFINTFKYPEIMVSLEKYTIIEPDRIRSVFNWFQYFTRDSIRREFEEAGFCIDGCYRNVAGEAWQPESEEFTIVASKN